MVAQKYINFKHALEYFVTHLEYVQNNNSNIPGYTKYLKPFIDSKTFKKQGAGYSVKRDFKIKKQIEPYSKYEYGSISITILPSKLSGNYTHKGCYLHWLTTSINIVAVWEKRYKKSHIKGLLLLETKWKNEKFSRKNIIDEINLIDLDLFSGKAPNKTLIELYNAFEILLFKNEDKINEDFEKSIGIESHKAPKERIFRSKDCEKRIKIKHTELQQKFVQKLKKIYGDKAVFQEAAIQNNKLDVLVKINEGNKIFYDIYEIKSYESFYACFREAAGQLMEYKYKANEKGLNIRKLIIAGTAECDTKYLEYIQTEYNQCFDYLQI